jgi:S1-C subfamily serine protease
MKRYLVLCLISAAVGAAISNSTAWREAAPRATAQEPVPTPRVARSAPADVALDVHLTPEERTNISVYESANRGVVNIDTKSVRRDSFFFVEVPSSGSGSGSVLDRAGHILTNFHVVDDAQQIEVTLASGNSYRARLVGRDATNDIAVLKIDAPPEELHPLELGDSTPLRIGQKVYAIGNPFGLERTLTVGIVSSLNRSLPSRLGRRIMKSIIQVDAAMNPGNSGGPLLDTAGRVIGMNTAIASKTGQNTGVGFAIPANRIKRVVPELIRTGHVVRAELGVTRVLETERGLLVATVAPGSAAEQAGLKGFRVVRRQERNGPFVYETQAIDRSQADLIVAINGQPITAVEDLLNLIDEQRPGDEVQVRVIRAGKAVDVSVRLGASES